MISAGIACFWFALICAFFGGLMQGAGAFQRDLKKAAEYFDATKPPVVGAMFFAIVGTILLGLGK